MSESGLGSPAAVSTPSRLSSFLDRAGLQGFPWVSAIVLYTISWGWLLVVWDSIWWDDNYALNESWPEWIRASGLAPWTSIFNFVFIKFGPGFLHLSTFVTGFLSGIFFFSIVESRLSRLTTEVERKFMLLLFLSLPFNTAKVGSFNTPYTFSIFLFFLAWFLLVRFQNHRFFLPSLVFFFLSFQIPFMILFFLIPYFSFLIQQSGIKSISRVARSVYSKESIFLIATPITYLLLRQLLWPDKANAYQFHPETFLYAATILCLVVPVAMFALKINNAIAKRGLLLISIGYAACLIGLIPGIVTFQFADNALAKYPVLFLGRSAWHNRQLILQPLGFSIACIGVVSLLTGFSRGFQKVVFSSLTAVSVFFCFCFGLEHIIDNEKQVEIIDSLQAKQLRGDLEWIFIDDSIFLNARGRGYRSSDWAGFVFRADPQLLDIRTADMSNLDNAFSTRCPLFWNKDLVANVVSVQGPETHWQALKNWVRDRDMGFKVTVDDTPGACKPEMVTAEKVSGAIPILFYFTGAKN